MARALLLAFLVGLVHTPIMAEAGVYELPDYANLCSKVELASLK